MNQCYGCNTCKSADKPLEGFGKNSVILAVKKEAIKNAMSVFVSEF